MFIFSIVDYVCMWGDVHLCYCGRGYNTWVYKIDLNICFLKICGFKKDRLNTFPGATYMQLHDFSDCSVDSPKVEFVEFFHQDSSTTIDQMEHPPQLFLSLCKQQACTNPVYKSQADLQFGNTKRILDQAVNPYFDLHSNDLLQRISVKSYVLYMGI